jgi:hypothetical protein
MANEEFSLLIKLLNMTTSDNDGVALVATRKANAQLSKLGWTWDKLLSGKVTIIEDPFKGVDTPRARAAAPPPPPPRPKPTPPPPPRPAPRPINPAPPPRQHYAPKAPPPGASTSTLAAKARRPSKHGSISIDDLV